MDAILSLRLLGDLQRESDRPLYAAFIDLKAAFDSVDREALWKAMKGIGTPKIILDLIKDLYTHTTSRVRFGQSLSDTLQTRSGVRQGCVLAPALFCRAIDWLLHNALQGRGIEVSNEKLSDTDYADDIAALGHSINQLSESLDSIDEYSKYLGLNISWTKTKIQNIGAGNTPPDLPISGNTVESVNQFVYLGRAISSENGSRSEQLRRIGLDCICNEVSHTNMENYSPHT